MKWRGRRASRNIQDRRHFGGKGKAAGGGIAFLVIGGIVALLGGDPSFFLQEGINRTFQTAPGSGPSKIPKEQQDELVQFVSVVLAETETTWNKQFAAMNMAYPEPTLVFFTGAVTSACGRAQSAMGPFYCPADQKIYIDLDFFYDLAKRHNAAGDFAQAYVIAHEVGHHVQHVLGVLEQSQAAKSRGSKIEANKISVKTELMADCFAGLWAKDVDQKGLLEQGDIREALNAATQIGDDRLQQQAHGHVVPDSFTHGSGEQRYAWFERGYKTGDINACNTFG